MRGAPCSSAAPSTRAMVPSPWGLRTPMRSSFVSLPSLCAPPALKTPRRVKRLVLAVPVVSCAGREGWPLPSTALPGCWHFLGSPFCSRFLLPPTAAFLNSSCFSPLRRYFIRPFSLLPVGAKAPAGPAVGALTGGAALREEGVAVAVLSLAGFVFVVSPGHGLAHRATEGTLTLVHQEMPQHNILSVFLLAFL